MLEVAVLTCDAINAKGLYQKVLLPFDTTPFSAFIEVVKM